MLGVPYVRNATVTLGDAERYVWQNQHQDLKKRCLQLHRLGSGLGRLVTRQERRQLGQEDEKDQSDGRKCFDVKFIHVIEHPPAVKRQNPEKIETEDIYGSEEIPVRVGHLRSTDGGMIRDND